MFGFFKKATTTVTRIAFNTLGAARWMSRDTETYAREGYEENTIVFRCVDIVAQSVASIPVKLVELASNGDRRDIDNHPLLDLLNRPNPVQTYEDLAFSLVAYNLITGAAFLEAFDSQSEQPVIEPSRKPPLELWTWQPFRFSVYGNDLRPMPRGYAWGFEGSSKKLWKVDQVTGESQMLCWKSFHPREKLLGLSPISPAARSVDQHNAAAEWNQKMLQNNAQPPGAFVYAETMGKEAFDRLAQQIGDHYTGPDNARQPLILEGGADYKTLAMSPVDMDWLEGKRVAAQEIAAAFGVPTQVIPIEGSQTFANYEQARLALWEDTVIPKQARLLNTLELFLFPKFGLDPSRYRLEPDLDEIPALSPRRKEKWETANSTNFLTLNEKRELVGYEKYNKPEADEILIPSNLLPLAIGETSSSLDEEPEEMTEDDAMLGGADDQPT